MNWQSTVQPEEQPVQQQFTSDNPDVQYIFELCQGIKEKLDLLQQACAREEIQEYGENQLRSVITDLIGAETKIIDDTTLINSISDMVNNLTRTDSKGGPVKMMNGLIQF